MADTIRPNIDSREGYSLEEQLAYEAYLADGGDVTDEDYEEMCDYFDSLEEECEYDEEYDGQPDEYTEWQDYMGGDDWDQGQYDEY